MLLMRKTLWAPQMKAHIYKMLCVFIASSLMKSGSLLLEMGLEILTIIEKREAQMSNKQSE